MVKSVADAMFGVSTILSLGLEKQRGSCSEDTGAGTSEEEQQLFEMPSHQRVVVWR